MYTYIHTHIYIYLFHLQASELVAVRQRHFGEKQKKKREGSEQDYLSLR
jgi:hypothetical protein